MLNSLTSPMIVVLLSVAAGAGYAQDPHLDSPQLAFESYSTALAKNDWNAVYSAVSPGSRDYMIFESIFALGMDDKNEKAKAITAKYVDEAKLEQLYAGFKGRPTTAEAYSLLSQSIKDKKGMFVAGLKLSELHTTDKPRFGPLSELVISKGVASAKTAVTSTIVHYSNAGGNAKDVRHVREVTRDIQVYFTNSSGKWLFATVDEWQQQRTENQNVLNKSVDLSDGKIVDTSGLILSWQIERRDKIFHVRLRNPTAKRITLGLVSKNLEATIQVESATGVIEYYDHEYYLRLLTSTWVPRIVGLQSLAQNDWLIPFDRLDPHLSDTPFSESVKIGKPKISTFRTFAHYGDLIGQ